jgi:hypothetical protein
MWKARKATQISYISKNRIYFTYQQNEAALAILDEKLLFLKAHSVTSKPMALLLRCSFITL